MPESPQKPRRRILILVIAILLIGALGAWLAWKMARRAVIESVRELTVPVEKTIDLGAIVTQVRELSRLETASMKVMHVSTITQSYQMVPDSLSGDELTFLAAGDVIAGIDLSAIVTQVRELSRLETASMKVMHVSTITQSYQMVPDSLSGDELTFLAAGDVIAGIDLSRLKDTDIRRDTDGSIVMRLPPSEILITRVDNKESRVITRKTGFLRRADVNLESRVRQAAEQSIRNEAVRKGILLMASQNAEKKLADFLHALGFQKVRFESSSFARPTA